MAKRIRGMTIEIGGSATKLEQSLKNISKESKETAKELNKVNSALEGKGVTNKAELLAQKQRLYKDEIANTTKALEELRKAEVEMLNSGDYDQSKYDALQRDIANAEARLVSLNAESNKFVQSWAEAGKKISEFGKQISDFGDKWSKSVSAPATAVLTYASKQAVDFEHAFTGVRKTSNLAAEELDKLSGELRDLSTEIPATAEELSSFAEAAGRMNIGDSAEEVADFTEVIAEMGAATDLIGEDAADSMGKFANITKTADGDIRRIGSTIVELGNNGNVTESVIMNLAQRIAAAGDQAGMSESDILGLASAMTNVGLTAESGGTSMSKLIQDMQLAANSGGEDLQKFADAAKVSTSEFKAAVEGNAIEAVRLLINGIAETADAGGSVIGVIDDLGIGERRMTDMIQRLVNNNEGMVESIDLANIAWQENTALAEEAAMYYETTSNKLQVSKNRLDEAARSLGDQMLPVLADTAEMLGGLLERYSELDDDTQKLIRNTLLFAAAFGPVLSTTGRAIDGIGRLATNMSNLRKQTIEGTGAISKFITATGGLTTAGKIGLVVAGVGLLTKAFLDAREAATAVTEETESLLETLNDFKNGEYDNSIDITGTFDADKGREVIDSIYELEAALKSGEISAGDAASTYASMNGMIAEANLLVPDLGIAFDETTNSVNMSAKAVEDYLKVKELQVEAEIELDKYKYATQQSAFTRAEHDRTEKAIELYDERLKLRESFDEVLTEQEYNAHVQREQEIDRLLEESGFGASKRDERKARNSLDTLESTLTDWDAIIDEAQSNYKSKSSELNTFISDSNEERDELRTEDIESEEEQSAELEKALEERNKLYEEHVDALLDAYGDMQDATAENASKINEISSEGFEQNETSMAEWLKGIKKRQEEYLDWQNNLKALAEQGLPSALVAELTEAGPEYADLVAQMVEDSDGLLDDLVAEWSETWFLLQRDQGEYADLLQEGASETVQGMATAVIDEAVRLYEAGEEIPLELAKGIEVAYPLAETASRVMMDKVFAALGDGSEAETVGKNIAAGLEKGIDNSAWRPESAAGRMATRVNATLANIAQTQSPSKFTEQIGLWYGEGYAIGIEESYPRVVAAIERFAGGINDAVSKSNEQLAVDLRKLDEDHNYDKETRVRKYNSSIADIRQKAADENRSLTADEQWDLQDKERSHKRDMLDMEQQYQQDRLDMIEQAGLDVVALGEQYIKDQQWIGQMSIQEEIIYWNQMYRALESGSAAYEQALSNHQSAVARLRSQIESAMSDYSGQMTQITTSYQSELERIEDNYAKESARIAEQSASAIASASEKASSDRLREAENYASNRKQIEEKLVSDLAALDQQYADSLDNRTKQLANFTGLFERWLHPAGVPEGQLLQNIKSQVEGLQAYEDVMTSLEDKIDNEALIEELRELGPGSISELEALNRMSDDQLTEFVSLYEERFRLASERAVVEMEPLKDDLSRQAEELRKQTAIDLDNLYKEYQQALARINAEMRSAQTRAIADARAAQKQLDEDAEAARKKLEEDTEEALTTLEEEWIDRIKAIVLGTEEQFDSMYQVGIDAIDGLKRGMDSAAPALYAKAESIAAKVNSTIKDAFQISSPSKLWYSFGKELSAGLAGGIEANAKQAIQSTKNMTRQVISAGYPGDVGVPVVASGRYAGAAGAGSGGATYGDTIIYVNNPQPSPSELARQIKRQQIQLAEGFR